MVLIFSHVDMIYHVDCFMNVLRCVQGCLYPGDKLHLVIMNNPLNVLLDPIGWYLGEKFCTYVHQGYWSAIPLFGEVLSGLGIKVKLAS